RVAAKQTVENMNATGTEPVKRDDFRTKLRQAIDAVMAPPPKTKDAADRMMESGASQANSAMRGHLATERDEAAKPFESAAHNEVPPNKVQPEMQQTKLEIESVGAPPAPVSAAPVVPAPLPAERLDYSSDREPTDQAMAENGVTKEQLEKGNEPAFESTLKERSAVEKHEAKLEAQYRQSEAKVQGNAHDAARKEIAKGLGGIHGARALHIGNVAGQQVGTRDKSELEHKRITDKINEIKRNTKDAVEFILKAMDTNAMFLFNMGLKAAEAAYENTFKEEKGGKWTWLTTWGSSWERLIERSLAKARAEYFRQVEQAIDIVADYVDDQLRTAKLRVTSGFNEVKVFVNSLDKNFKQFGKEALDKVKTDFDDMGSEIDQHSDQLVDNLAQTYKASYQRMSTMEEKLREENKSLWQRIYDATVGLIKKIIAFKDMLMNVLAKAADVIGDIISDPIGFLGNLVDGVKLGIQNFSDHIEEHLKQGLIEWLFGELAAGGIQMPKTFDLKGILGLVMQILGLTYANIRARAVGIVGEKVVSALEQAAEIFKILITEGPGGLWKYIVEKIGDFKETILEQIKSFIIERIIVAGITWLIGLLNPASAFFKACKAIYDIIMFFVDHASQIAAFLNAIIDSIGAIAKGAIDVAAKFVESALAKAIPLIIGFLASLLGLGGISEKIKEIIAKIREPINAAIDWVIKKAVDMVKGIGKMLGFGKEEKKEEELPKDHSAMAEKAVAELEKPREEGEDYATLRKEKEAQAKDIELTYTAKLEPGIRLRVVFSEAGKGAEQDELDFDVIIAPNQVDRKGKVKASAEYKAPEVGSYKEMAKLGESEPKMKGGKMREAHHAPPVELAESLAAALTTAGNEMRSDPKTRDASEGVLDAAANLKGAAQQHGNDLPSILVHQDTHRTHGGSTARIHGSEIRAQLKKALEAEGVLDYAPTTSTGEVAVKPGGAAFQRQLETIALVQTGTSATTKKAMRAALKSHGPDIVIAAYNAEARRSLQAVKIAVMKSEVDGPKAKRAAALTELENRAYADWDALLAPIFSD
ncbi:MAG TPA: hypothetical protein VK619_06210, partial [Pyrinomonadaceae bacterium]|nr:hypothetical protein [Pyrinomonadaceae bacterium]